MSSIKEADVLTLEEGRSKKKNKPKLDLTRKNLTVVAPYLWIKRDKKLDKKKYDLHVPRPSVLLRDLSMYLSDTVNIPNILNETSMILKFVTNSTGAIYYLCDIENDFIYFCPTSRETDEERVQCKFMEGTILAYVAAKREFVLTNSLFSDERFPKGVGSLLGLSVTGVLCVPVVMSDGELFAIIQLYRENGIDYENKQLEITIAVTNWMAIAIDQNQQRILLQKQKKINDYLVELAQHYFNNIEMLPHMIKDIVDFAKETMTVERATFYVLDKNTNELIVETLDEKQSEEDLLSSAIQKKKFKMRLNKERVIAELSVKYGQIINIKDAYNDSRFDREIDQKTGFIIRSVLCMPVIGQDGVLGVLQIINKQAGYFRLSDEKLIKIFSIYCTLALQYTRLNVQLIRSIKITEIYNELLSYHLSYRIIEPELFQRFSQKDIPTNFDGFDWYPHPKYTRNLTKLSVYIFFKILDNKFTEASELFNFIYTIKRCYRENPYHNFEHAFNVLHSIYCILIRHPQEFNYYEKIALLIGAICHDVDHRGFTNNYHQLCGSPLVTLYDESPLECHHNWIATKIITSTAILKNISTEYYKEIMNYIKEAILSTDLTRHLKIRTKIRGICDSDTLDWKNDNHRTFVRHLMMTSADLSGQAKPFKIAKRLVDNVFNEFYNDGDQLKKLGVTPLVSMDREHKNQMSENQVEFLDVICLPCYDLLKTVLPQTLDIYNLCKDLQNTWKRIVEKEQNKEKESKMSNVTE